MGLWDKVQQELDRAGAVAKDALDEGKVRIELFRVRQNADKAAQALGYAVHRARRDGKDMDPATLERLHNGLLEREAEAKALEEQLAAVLRKEGKAPQESPKAGSDAPPPGSGGTDASKE